MASPLAINISGSNSTLKVTSARLIVCEYSLFSSLVSFSVPLPPPPSSSTTAVIVKGSGTVPVGIASVIVPVSAPSIGKVVIVVSCPISTPSK